MRYAAFISLLVVALVACAPRAGVDPGYGGDVTLPAPHGGLLPTVHAAKAVGWPEGGAPTAPEGFIVSAYARDISHPRWLYVLPNGDVLVAQSATRAARGGGIEEWVANQVERRAGAMANDVDRITLLRDSDADGDVDAQFLLKDGLNQPFGMAFLDGYLYIANTDAVLRFPFTLGDTRLEGDGETILELPYRAVANGHWTRSLAVRPDGLKLYVAVGSATNIGDDGVAVEEGRAAIWEFDPDGSRARVFAGGLRNPVGLAFEPVTGALWTAVNERDMLGDNLVPDYMTSVRDGAFYGWPQSYFGQHVDERVQPRDPAIVALATAPDYALGAHTASLGLHFYVGEALPEHYRGGAFIGQHGSWNRSTYAGYKVVYVPFQDGRPAGPPEDFLTGFLNARGEAQGRPVGVIMDQTGAILVADDAGNRVWRVAWGG